MPKKPSPKRAALLIRVLIIFGLIVALPNIPLDQHANEAHATVSASDLIYAQTPGDHSTENIILRNASTGAETTLISGGFSQTPDVSKDGSIIIYQHTPTTSAYLGIWRANSDGSGVTQLTFPNAYSPSNSDHFTDLYPRWSPDGNRVVFERQDYQNYTHIYTMNSDGSGVVDLSSGTPGANYDSNPTWSPDGTRIAFTRLNYRYQTEVWVMNTDGTNAHVISTGGCDYNQPDWSPDGSRIYFSYCSSELDYLTSGDGFSTATQSTRNYLASVPGNDLRVSGDGTKIYYGNSSQVWSVTTTGTTSQITNAVSPIGDWQPAPVKSTFPAAPPSNASVTLSTPSPSDSYGQRKITINLSSTGIQKFQYGWSTTTSTAPNSSYLQESTDLTNKVGTLNFIGKLISGTYYGGTQPDQDWYLWVRSVQTGGTLNAWGTPLKIHTPKTPVWVGIGDSYSSGHHQDYDEQYCPSSTDAPFYPGTPACAIAGAPHLIPNDSNFSWVTWAASNFNSNFPAAWKIQPKIVAQSGAATSTFGASGTTVGTATWANQGQAGQMSALIYPNYNSWNIVSVTGGADDTNWSSVLASWYSQHFTSSTGPWAVNNGISNCPDANSVYNKLTDTSTGLTLDTQIQSYLNGIVTVATSHSPGVRVLNIGYPDVNDSTGNSCFADSGSIRGTHTVVTHLNSDHSAVTGSNVRYVSLTASTSFGSSPISNGYIQLTRLYGYPHPTSWSLNGGQAKISSAALSTLSSW